MARLRIAARIYPQSGTDADEQPQTIMLVGQFARTLRALVSGGNRGVTSLEISTWALRTSHYVFILRHRYGLEIDMQLEDHDGPAGPGRHGRYFLRSRVIIEETGDRQGRAA